MTLTAITPDDPRAAYIKGMRRLLDALEQNPGIPLPYEGDLGTLGIQFLSGDDPRAAMAEAARAIPCSWQKRFYDGGKDPSYFYLEGELDGIKLQLTAYREAVCERIVTGTEDREVEEVVTPAVTRTVTKPVETVEWHCAPILAPVSAKTGEAA